MRPPHTSHERIDHPTAAAGPSSSQPSPSGHQAPVPGVGRVKLRPPNTHRRATVAGCRPRLRDRSGRAPRRAGRRSMWLPVALLTVALGGIAAASSSPTVQRTADATVAHRAALQAPASPTPTPPSGSLPPPVLPLPTPGTCTPGVADPVCLLTPSPTPPPASTNAPGCTGEDCIPQPATTTPGTGPIGGSGGGGGSDCSFWDPSTWLNCIFQPLVTDALNPLLDLLGHTLLTTPSPSSIPQIGVLWTGSWQILVASYGVLVLIAGIIVMAYSTLQSRYTVKEIAPRVAGGFLAGTLSLFAATKMIELANGLAYGLLGGGVNAGQAAGAFRSLALNALTGGIWLIFVGLVLAVMILVLLVVYVVRVAITILLLVAAPIFLMFHALPHTNGLAAWWWKAFTGVLAIQVAQSLVLVVAMNALLSQGPSSLFGGP